MDVYGTKVSGTFGSAGMPVEVSVSHISKTFGDSLALADVCLSIRAGELIAVIGGSGSGKTTLLRHLTGHFHPDSGTVSVANHEALGSPLVELSSLDSSGMKKLQRHWAVVLQRNGLLAGTVYDNIALPLRYVLQLDEADVRARVQIAINAVGLDFARDASLRVDELSGGMAKRVTIAWALAADPILLFYDEPTSGLDPMLAKQIQELIRSVHQSCTSKGFMRTSLIVTHDKDLLQNLRPRILLLDAGRVSFDGTYDAFAKSNTAAAKAYLGSPELAFSETPLV